MQRRFIILSLCALGLSAGCSDDPMPEGLAPRPLGDLGPEIVFNPLTRPFPEVPLPNDVAVRLDDGTPTGLRLNVGVELSTELAGEIRQDINELDGWGTFAPITIPFHDPIDLSTVGPETVKVVNVTPEHPRFGQVVPLDFGLGSFPVNVKPGSYFAHDPLNDMTQWMFAEGNEVDRDGDGTKEFVRDYEVASNTLVLRPFMPLDPQTRYAVIVSRGITGHDGEPIRSPFPHINHFSQTDELAPLHDLMPSMAMTMDEVAFTWTFTTQSTTTVLEKVRDGLDGIGPLAWLKDEYPTKFSSMKNLGITHDGDGSDENMPFVDRDHLYVLQPAFLEQLFGAIGFINDDVEGATFDNVDYFVFGTFTTPNFRASERTLWQVDPIKGTAVVGTEEVPFLIAVPKETEAHKAPFPVAMYAHGARTSRFESVLVSDRAAELGIAIMSMDAAGHGPFLADAVWYLENQLGLDPSGFEQPTPDQRSFNDNFLISIADVFVDLVAPQVETSGYLKFDELWVDMLNIGVFDILFGEGRTVDADGDGRRQSGDGYFTPNPLKVRDALRQTAVDYMFGVRLLKSLTQEAVPPAIDTPRDADPTLLDQSMLAGDFNADGKLDIGGVDNRYWLFGTSLGAINTTPVAALDKNFNAYVNIVGGGGMGDMLLRSTLREALEKIYHEIIGPIVVGCPMTEDATQVALSFNNDSVECSSASLSASDNAKLAILDLTGMTEVEMYNPINGERERVPLKDRGAFSVSVGADKGTKVKLTFFDAEGNEHHPTTLTARYSGQGHDRNTPNFRKTVYSAQTGFDAGDPINYAKHIWWEPLPGLKPTPMLHLATPGDRVVPFATSVALDRAAGLYGTEEEDILAFNAQVVATGNLTYDARVDIDDIDNDNDGFGPAPKQPVEGGKFSAVRYHYDGDHEYICCQDQGREIDWATYARNQIMLFFLTDGEVLAEGLCLDRFDVKACCDERKAAGETFSPEMEIACERL